MRVPLAEVPMPIRRKAFQLIESLHDKAMGGGETFELARVTNDVTPMLRPDIEGVAYYEFIIELIPRAPLTTDGFTNIADCEKARPARSVRNRHGFVIVSTGAHDFPRPHWSLDLAPVSERLLAAAGEKKIARIYKADALCYIAEDAEGRDVARVGMFPLPVRIRPNAKDQVLTASAAPPEMADDDSTAEKARHVPRAPQAPADIEVRTDVTTWPQMKKLYRELFGPFLKSLRDDAARPWRIDGLVEKFGEGILVGEPFRLALLESQARIEATGEGAAWTRLRFLERGGVAQAVELLAVQTPPRGGADLFLRICYQSGAVETLRFFITAKDTPSQSRGAFDAPEVVR